MGSDVRISTVAIAQGNLDHPRHRDAAGQPARALLQDGHHQGRAAHPDPDRRQPGNKMAVLSQGVSPAEAGRRAQCPRRRPARHHLDPAGDQGRRRPAGRYPGDRMMDAGNPVARWRWRSPRRSPRRRRAPTTRPRTRRRRNSKASSSPSSWARCSRASRPTVRSAAARAKQMFRSLMLDQYGKQIADQRRLRPVRRHHPRPALPSGGQVIEQPIRASTPSLKMAERLIEALHADIAALEARPPARHEDRSTREIQLLCAQYGREAASAEPPRTAGRARRAARPPDRATTKRFQDALALHARMLTRIRTCQRRHDQGRGRRSRQAPQPRPALFRALRAPRRPHRARPASSLLYNAVV